MKRLALGILLLAAAPAAAEEWTLDPSAGTLRVIVRRTGILMAFGHDHVIDVPDYEGKFSFAAGEGSVSLSIDTAGLIIDSLTSRPGLGLKGKVKKKYIPKIRKSMRGPKGLDVARYKEIRFVSEEVEEVAGSGGAWRIRGNLALHGEIRPISFVVVMTEEGGALRIKGAVRIKPSHFGIKPFSLAGLIKVKDEAEVVFDLLARSSRPVSKK